MTRKKRKHLSLKRSKNAQQFNSILKQRKISFLSALHNIRKSEPNGFGFCLFRSTSGKLPLPNHRGVRCYAKLHTTMAVFGLKSMPPPIAKGVHYAPLLLLVNLRLRINKTCAGHTRECDDRQASMSSLLGDRFCP